jgi:hypothetical protein
MYVLITSPRRISNEWNDTYERCFVVQSRWWTQFYRANQPTLWTLLGKTLGKTQRRIKSDDIFLYKCAVKNEFLFSFFQMKSLEESNTLGCWRSELFLSGICVSLYIFIYRHKRYWTWCLFLLWNWFESNLGFLFVAVNNYRNNSSPHQNTFIWKWITQFHSNGFYFSLSFLLSPFAVIANRKTPSLLRGPNCKSHRIRWVQWSTATSALKFTNTPIITRQRQLPVRKNIFILLFRYWITKAPKVRTTTWPNGGRWNSVWKCGATKCKMKLWNI